MSLIKKFYALLTEFRELGESPSTRRKFYEKVKDMFLDEQHFELFRRTLPLNTKLTEVYLDSRGEYVVLASKRFPRKWSTWIPALGKYVDRIVWTGLVYIVGVDDSGKLFVNNYNIYSGFTEDDLDSVIEALLEDVRGSLGFDYHYYEPQATEKWLENGRELGIRIQGDLVLSLKKAFKSDTELCDHAFNHVGGCYAYQLLDAYIEKAGERLARLLEDEYGLSVESKYNSHFAEIELSIPAASYSKERGKDAALILCRTVAENLLPTFSELAEEYFDSPLPLSIKPKIVLEGRAQKIDSFDSGKHTIWLDWWQYTTLDGLFKVSAYLDRNPRNHPEYPMWRMFIYVKMERLLEPLKEPTRAWLKKNLSELREVFENQFEEHEATIPYGRHTVRLRVYGDPEKGFTFPSPLGEIHTYYSTDPDLNVPRTLYVPRQTLVVEHPEHKRNTPRENRRILRESRARSNTRLQWNRNRVNSLPLSG